MKNTMIREAIKNNKSSLTWLLLCALLAIGFYLRGYQLFTDSLWIDEGFTIMQEQAIAEHGYPLLRSGNIELKDPLFPYLLAIGDIFLNVTFLHFRFLAALFGTATIALAFWLGKQLLGARAALCIAFLFTFSYWHIAWSRQVRSYTVATFLLLAVLTAFIQYVRTGKRTYGVALAAFSLLLIAAKTGIGMLMLAALVATFLLRKQHTAWAVGGVVFLLLAFLFRSKINIHLDHTLLQHFGYYLVGYLWEYFGLVFLLSLPGIYLAVRKDTVNQQFHILALIFSIITIIFFSFFTQVAQRRYLFVLSSLIFFYSWYALYYLWPKQKNSTLFAGAALAAILVIDSITVRSFMFLPRSSFALEEYTPQPNFREAYEFLQDESRKDCTVVSPYPYLDQIYLGKVDYALPISYTGSETEASLSMPTEYYTDAPRVLDGQQLSLLAERTRVCVMLDTMAFSRVPDELVDVITSKGVAIYEDTEKQTSAITIFEISR